VARSQACISAAVRIFIAIMVDQLAEKFGFVEHKRRRVTNLNFLNSIEILPLTNPSENSPCRHLAFNGRLY